MKLQFKIDDRYLIHFASKRYHSKPANFNLFLLWTPLVDRIHKKYRDTPAYYFLNFSNNEHISWAAEELLIASAFPGKSFNSTFCKIVSDMERIYDDIRRSKEFKQLRKETEQHLLQVSKQWDLNKKFTLSFIQEVTGITLPNKTITVFITHPKLANGRALITHNAILWGHEEDWKNYHTVYLCHELMHILTKEKQGNEKIMHSLTELITDNELRIRLNHTEDYFNEGGHLVGHKDLQELEQKILPIWQDYLAGKLKAKNIFELEKYIIKKGIA